MVARCGDHSENENPFQVKKTPRRKKDGGEELRVPVALAHVSLLFWVCSPLPARAGLAWPCGVA
ncbi:hypothetical protein DA2_1298 [Desulfovibrio sp. A2]|nr:hypothetical protein DA2_1298 [Desulfovibrio sp. A2]